MLKFKLNYRTTTHSVLFFVFLLPAIATAAPFDRGWIKERVLDELSDILGRRIEVAGELDIDLSWTPTLRAEQVRIENAEWSEHPYMAELGVLEVSIDLSKLIKGQVVLPQLQISEPRLLLEVSAENQANWHFVKADAEVLPQAQKIAEDTLDAAIREVEKSGEPPPTQGEDVQEDLQLPLIKRLRVDSGRFRYLNHINGIDLEGALQSVAGQSDSEKTQIEIQAGLEDRPVSLRIEGGPIHALSKAEPPFPLMLSIEAEDFSVALSGDLRRPLELGGGQLTLAVEGSGMPALVNAWTGAELPALPDYRLQAQVVHDGASRWDLSNLNAHFGASDLSGDLFLDYADSLPMVSAKLRSDTLNFAELNAIAAGFEFNGNDISNEPVVIDVSVLRQLNAEFALTVANLIAPGGVTVNQVTMQAKLTDGQLDLQPLQLNVGGGSVRGELSFNATTPLTGEAALILNAIDLDRVLNELSQDEDGSLGILSGSTRIRLVETETDNGKVALLALLDHLRLQESELQYRDMGEGTELTLNAAVVGEQHELQLQAHGKLQNQRVELDIQGGPLTNLNDPNVPYTVSGHAAVGEIEGDIKGAIRRNGDIWQLHDFAIGFGNSRLYGEGSLDLSGDKPKLEGNFTAPLLDLTEFSGFNSQTDTKSSKNTEAPGLATASPNLAALRSFDADLSLNLEKIKLPSFELTNARVELAVNNGKLSIDPLQAELNGNTIALSGSLDASGESPSGQFVLNLGEIDLTATAAAFGGELPPAGTLSGKLSFAFSGEPAKHAADLALPGVGRITIEPSELRYKAPDLNIDVSATVSSRMTDEGRQQLSVNAKGRYLDEPFELDISGDSPLVLLDPRQDYALEGRITLLDTTVKISGRLPQPLNLAKLDLSVAINGPDPAILKPVLDFPLPELPPYSIKGRLKRDGDIIELHNFSGKVGDSDIAGDLRVELNTDPLVLYATLYSDKIDLDDLAGLIGGTPDADPGETASAEQRQEQIRKEQSPYLLPRESLNLHRVSQMMNGVIKFSGKRLIHSKLPFDELDFTLKINKGRVTLKPLTFVIGGGRVQSNIQLNTRKQPVEGTIETEVTRVNLRELLASFEIAHDSLGVIGGRMKLWVAGDSVAQWFASADGGLFLLMTEGKLDALLTELAGLDIGEALVALVGDVETVPIDCAYIDAHSEHGIMKLETALIDTSDTLFLADGFIDFNQELISMVVEPKPKDISFFSLRSPLYIEGRLKKPSVYPGASSILARGAAATLLGAATPLAALLPFIEPGSGEEPVYCNGLIDAIDKAR